MEPGEVQGFDRANCPTKNDIIINKAQVLNKSPESDSIYSKIIKAALNVLAELLKVLL